MKRILLLTATLLIGIGIGAALPATDAGQGWKHAADVWEYSANLWQARAYDCEGRSHPATCRSRSCLEEWRRFNTRGGAEATMALTATAPEVVSECPKGCECKVAGYNYRGDGTLGEPIQYVRADGSKTTALIVVNCVKE